MTFKHKKIKKFSKTYKKIKKLIGGATPDPAIAKALEEKAIKQAFEEISLLPYSNYFNGMDQDPIKAYIRAKNEDEDATEFAKIGNYLPAILVAIVATGGFGNILHDMYYSGDTRYYGFAHEVYEHQKANAMGKEPSTPITYETFVSDTGITLPNLVHNLGGGGGGGGSATETGVGAVSAATPPDTPPTTPPTTPPATPPATPSATTPARESRDAGQPRTMTEAPSEETLELARTLIELTKPRAPFDINRPIPVAEFQTSLQLEIYLNEVDLFIRSLRDDNLFEIRDDMELRLKPATEEKMVKLMNIFNTLIGLGVHPHYRADPHYISIFKASLLFIIDNRLNTPAPDAAAAPPAGRVNLHTLISENQIPRIFQNYSIDLSRIIELLGITPDMNEEQTFDFASNSLYPYRFCRIIFERRTREIYKQQLKDLLNGMFTRESQALEDAYIENIMTHGNMHQLQELLTYFKDLRMLKDMSAFKEVNLSIHDLLPIPAGAAARNITHEIIDIMFKLGCLSDHLKLHIRLSAYSTDKSVDLNKSNFENLFLKLEQLEQIIIKCCENGNLKGGLTAFGEVVSPLYAMGEYQDEDEARGPKSRKTAPELPPLQSPSEKTSGQFAKGWTIQKQSQLIKCVLDISRYLLCGRYDFNTKNYILNLFKYIEKGLAQEQDMNPILTRLQSINNSSDLTSLGDLITVYGGLTVPGTPRAVGAAADLMAMRDTSTGDEKTSVKRALAGNTKYKIYLWSKKSSPPKNISILQNPPGYQAGLYHLDKSGTESMGKDWKEVEYTHIPGQ